MLKEAADRISGWLEGHKADDGSGSPVGETVKWKGGGSYVYHIGHSQGAYRGDHTGKSARAGQLWLPDQQGYHEEHQQHL